MSASMPSPALTWPEFFTAHPQYTVPMVSMVTDALAEAVAEVRETPGHISGMDLSRQFVAMARARYGYLAPHVLAAWGLHTDADLGRLVFALVEANIWQKQESDSHEDFAGRVDFAAALADESYDWTPAVKAFRANPWR